MKLRKAISRARPARARPARRQQLKQRTPCACLCGVAVLMAASATASPKRSYHMMPKRSYHMMQVEQVIGGVSGDTSAQAIQLRMRFAFQNYVAGARLVAHDAQGLNPVVLIEFPNSVTNSDEGDRILSVSANFVSRTNPPTVPDFTLQNLIPASYLPAGRLTLEDVYATIYWSLAWGGSNYTGPNDGDYTNDADGDFGPPWSGPLPSSNTRALKFLGGASAMSTRNIDDYALTAGAATFTNNARTSFTIVGPTATTVFPSSYTFFRGVQVSGSLSDLFFSDDVRVVGRPGVVLNQAERPIQIIIEGTAPATTASSLGIVVEAHCNIPNIGQRVEVFNFTASAYTQLDQRNMPTSDLSLALDIPNPNQYIGAGRALRARISYKEAGPIFSYPWFARIDEATWRFTP